MLLNHQIDRSVDLLLDMATQALARGAAGGGKLLLGNSLLFQAGPQPGFAPPLFPVALVPPGKLALKRSILFSCGSGDKMSNPHIDAHERG